MSKNQASTPGFLPFLRKQTRPEIEDVMTFLQVVSFMAMQYVYFVNFRVKLGAVCSHKSSRCWELTLPNVSFCSLSVRNDQKTLFCLNFSYKELQVLLLNKLNFTHSRTHTIQCTVCLFMKKSFALKTAAVLSPAFQKIADYLFGLAFH